MVNTGNMRISDWQYLALQNAQSSLEDVHDRVVDAFPVVDCVVVMYTNNQIYRAVVFSRCGLSLRHLIIAVPAGDARRVLFSLDNLAKELDMAGCEEIEPSICIDGPLAW